MLQLITDNDPHVKCEMQDSTVQLKRGGGSTKKRKRKTIDCKFKKTPSPVIFAGVVPASKCYPDAPGTNATTQAVKQAIGETPNWIDILPYSPLQAFGKIGWALITTFIRDERRIDRSK